MSETKSPQKTRILILGGGQNVKQLSEQRSHEMAEVADQRPSAVGVLPKSGGGCS